MPNGLELELVGSDKSVFTDLESDERIKSGFASTTSSSSVKSMIGGIDFEFSPNRRAFLTSRRDRTEGLDSDLISTLGEGGIFSLPEEKERLVRDGPGLLEVIEPIKGSTEIAPVRRARGRTLDCEDTVATLGTDLSGGGNKGSAGAGSTGTGNKSAGGTNGGKSAPTPTETDSGRLLNWVA